jgi:uncharacterized protein (TIGR02145 family)
MIPKKQIGWSQEENLLWEISRELDKTITRLRSNGTTTITTTVNPCPTNCNQTTVDINGQIWDTCNLNVETYRDGSPIPRVDSVEEWSTLTTGAWCYYDFNPDNDALYGKLYNWYAIADPRGLAPLGKSIPTDAQWTALTTFLGGNSFAGGEMKQTGFCYWSAPNEGATNNSGFTALPGGFRSSTADFFSINEAAWFWSSTTSDAANAFTRSLDMFSAIVLRFPLGKGSGMSVRCLND